MTGLVVWFAGSDKRDQDVERRRFRLAAPYPADESGSGNVGVPPASHTKATASLGRWSVLDDQARAEGWVDRIRAGDERALEEMVRACYSAVATVARRYAGSRELAEEVTQDVFVRLWERGAELEITGGIMAYLFAAARHRALNARAPLRERALHVPSDAALGARRSRDTPELLYDAAELSRVLRLAVDRLSPRGREVFLLSRRDGLTPAQIALSLGINVQTVYTLLARALRELHDVIETMS